MCWTLDGCYVGVESSQSHVVVEVKELQASAVCGWLYMRPHRRRGKVEALVAKRDVWARREGF
jgi:hypothetical protein